VNRDELDRRNTAAVTHWWTTMRDSGRVEPGLLSDLAVIAHEHAEDRVVSALAHQRTLSTEKQAEAATRPPVVADLTSIGEAPAPLQPPGSGFSAAADPGRTIPSSPSSRTRTRTRGGPK
jgi:hypothetical protein